MSMGLGRRQVSFLLGGAALAWSSGMRAQQSEAPSIGILTAIDLQDWAGQAIREGLDEAGYAEGRNLTILSRSAGGQLDRLPTLAADLVSDRVSAILATGGPVPARAAKAATTQIPIVFAYGGDPVADGLVASFNRPEANVTGATFIGSALSGKRLDLLREIAPQMTDVALLVNPKGTLAESQIKDAETATRALGRRLYVANASNEAEIEQAFVTMGRLKINALLIGVDPLYGFVLGKEIVALAARYNIPAMYDSRSYIASGGLMSYGPVLPDTWRQSGLYVGRILKGDKPSDLPVIQPTKYELVINLKTAKSIGLQAPAHLLATADDVIE